MSDPARLAFAAPIAVRGSVRADHASKSDEQWIVAILQDLSTSDSKEDQCAPS